MNEELLCRIKKVIESEEQIIFSYIFGSFLHSENFNDIDIGVYCSEEILKNPYDFTSTLKLRLSEATNLPPDFFDITVINYCLSSDRADSLLILSEIFNGLLLTKRLPDLWTEIVEQVSSQMRESEGIIREAYL